MKVDHEAGDTNTSGKICPEASRLLYKEDDMKCKKIPLNGKTLFAPFLSKVIEGAAVFLVCIMENKTLLDYSSLPTNSQPSAIYMCTN